MKQTSSAINKEFLILSFISEIKAELNDFKRIWSFHNIWRQFKTPGSIPKTQFNVSAVIGFPKNGVDVTEIDIKIT